MESDEQLAASLRQRILERQAIAEDSIPESAILRGQQRLRFLTQKNSPLRRAGFLSGIAAGVIATWAAGIFLVPLLTPHAIEESDTAVLWASKSSSQTSQVSFSNLIQLLQILEKEQIPYVLAHEDKRSTITFQAIRPSAELTRWLTSNQIELGKDGVIRLGVKAPHKEVP